jgi:hypothetical protein
MAFLNASATYTVNCSRRPSWLGPGPLDGATDWRETYDVALALVGCCLAVLLNGNRTHSTVQEGSMVYWLDRTTPECGRK